MEEEVKNGKNFKICSGFVLKIVAFVTMAIDHIGLMAAIYGYTYQIFDVFRIIGRIAMPLFCFMIVEGVIHTKSFKKYILRLSILAAVIGLAIFLLVTIKELGFSGVRDFGNIFMDLFLGALTIFCLRQKGFKKLFALIPTAFVILSFTVSKVEAVQHIQIHWFPYFLRCQYHLMSFAFIVFFYFSYVIKDAFLKMHAKSMGLPEDTFIGTDLDRNTVNVLSMMFLLSLVLLFHFLSDYLTVSYMGVQIYALFSGAFILLYNGKRGYNSKWFEYGGYLFYPIHILLIALVFYLLSL